MNSRTKNIDEQLLRTLMFFIVVWIFASFSSVNSIDNTLIRASSIGLETVEDSLPVITQKTTRVPYFNSELITCEDSPIFGKFNAKLFEKCFTALVDRNRKLFRNRHLEFKPDILHLKEFKYQLTSTNYYHTFS